MSEDLSDWSTTATAHVPLRWPPPALERLHAAAWPIITLLGVGGASMTIPMLWLLSMQPPSWSPGPFDRAWWLPGIASVAGLGMVVVALVQACILLRGAVHGATRGYDTETMAYVIADSRRDAGFLMQGLRQYAAMPEDQRQWLLRVRVVVALALGLGVAWIPIAFTAGVLSATRGGLRDMESLWYLTLAPASVLLGAGLLARAFDAVVTRRARNAWRRVGARDEHEQREAAEWLDTRTANLGTAGPKAGGRWWPRFAAVGIGAITLMLPVPILLLALLSLIGPLFTRATAQRPGTLEPRIARAQVLQPYALDPDPSVGAMEAGEALNALVHVGSREKPHAPVERAPVRAYPDPWLPLGAPESLKTTEQLLTRALALEDTLTTEELAYFERVAMHPAHREFIRLARARIADIAGGRWNASALARTTWPELPTGRISRFRDAANVHAAVGLLYARNGDVAGAENALREVISAGLVLVQNSPTLLDVLIGSTVAEIGAHALSAFYEGNDRAADAHAIELALEGIDAAASAAKLMEPMRAANSSPRARMAIAADENVPSGIRWELLHSLRLSEDCINANAALFGRGTTYDDWLDKTRVRLVRFPSERALFDLMGAGLPAHEERRTSGIRGLLRFTFGQSGSAAACASLATAVGL